MLSCEARTCCRRRSEGTAGTPECMFWYLSLDPLNWFLELVRDAKLPLRLSVTDASESLLRGLALVTESGAADCPVVGVEGRGSAEANGMNTGADASPSKCL